MTSDVVDDASRAREAPPPPSVVVARDDASPTAREVVGAYDAAFAHAATSATTRAARRATTTTTLPTHRVGALVRALGAHVSATETDILNKCEALADPRGVGWFTLAEVRLRLRVCARLCANANACAIDRSID